jgi:two-component system sensor histidine kinase/response regulator
MAAGMNDYISKPVNPATLLAKLAEVAARLSLSPAVAEPAPAKSRAAGDLATAGVDVSALEMLDSVMSPTEVREFIEMFLDETATRLARMSTTDDMAALGADGHALVGIAGNVGAMAFSKLASMIDMSCKAGDLEAARKVLPELGYAAERASRALETWLKAKEPA